MTFLLGFLTACAGGQFYHDNIMRGQIVGIDNDEVVVCIGTDAELKRGISIGLGGIY